MLATTPHPPFRFPFHPFPSCLPAHSVHLPHLRLLLRLLLHSHHTSILCLIPQRRHMPEPRLPAALRPLEPFPSPPAPSSQRCVLRH